MVRMYALMVHRNGIRLYNNVLIVHEEAPDVYYLRLMVHCSTPVM